MAENFNQTAVLEYLGIADDYRAWYREHNGSVADFLRNEKWAKYKDEYEKIWAAGELPSTPYGGVSHQEEVSSGGQNSNTPVALSEEQRKAFTESIETDLRNILLVMQSSTSDDANARQLNPDQLLGTAYVEYKNIRGEELPQSGYWQTDDFNLFQEKFLDASLFDEEDGRYADLRVFYDDMMKEKKRKEENEKYLQEQMELFYEKLTLHAKKAFGEDITEDEIKAESDRAIDKWIEQKGERNTWAINIGLDWNRNQTGILNNIFDEDTYRMYEITNVDKFRSMYNFPLKQKEKTIDEISIGNDKVKENTIDEVMLPTGEHDLQDDKPVLLENDEYDIENKRIRSPYSDANEYFLDNIKLGILKDMELVDENINPSSEEELIKRLNEVKLTEKQQTEFDERLALVVAQKDEFLNSMPPAVLAAGYTTLKNAQDKHPDDKAYQEAFAKITARADDVITQYAKGEGYFFVDVTNAADVYKGYEALFAARYNDGDDNIKENIDKGRTYNNDLIKDYDRSLHISSIDEDDADNLNKRFDELSSHISSLEIDEETLKLIKNIKFESEETQLDENGKIKPDSKLAEMLEVARSNLIMENLGGRTPTNELKSEDLGESLTEVLYAAHVASKVEKGVSEDPKQFTDPQFLAQFKQDLATIDESHPLTISDTSLETTKDMAVNQICAFAHRVNDKLNADKNKQEHKVYPVATKLINSVAKFDKRKDDRIKTDTNKRAMRKKQALQALGGFGMAAGFSFALGTLTKINRVAGMAASGVLITASVIQTVSSYRKECKRNGIKGKFRWMKQGIKDPRFLSTVGITALGAAAFGFTATGNADIGLALGGGAMLLGGGKRAVIAFKDCIKCGMKPMEALAWSGLQAGATVAGGFAGRFGANQLANALGIGAEYIPGTPPKTVVIDEGGHHTYSDTEHRFVEMRNNDLRYSEHLGRIWEVNPEEFRNEGLQLLQDNAADHNWMNSVGADGQPHSNEQELWYKFTQYSALRPNDELTQNLVESLKNHEFQPELWQSLEDKVTLQDGTFRGQVIGDHEAYSYRTDAESIKADAGYEVDEPKTETISGKDDDYNPADNRGGPIATLGLYVKRPLQMLKDRSGSLADRIKEVKARLKKQETDIMPFRQADDTPEVEADENKPKITISTTALRAMLEEKKGK